MSTILVTGGAGFIGSHLCEKLLQRDNKIICVDNFNDYYSPLRKRENIKPLQENKNFLLQVIDITNKSKLEKVFKNNKIDKVVHLAARAGVRPSIKDPVLYQETNVSGTVNLLELSKQYGVKNFIFGSSSSVYGENKSRTFLRGIRPRRKNDFQTHSSSQSRWRGTRYSGKVRDKKIPFSEDDNVDYPISPYGASKKAVELYCSTYSHLTSLKIICLRFFTVYGPKGRPDMAPYLFTDWIYHGQELIRYGDGSTKRDYTYIDDIINGILAALEKNFKFEIINLGNAQTVELNYFIKVIEGILGKKAKIKQMPEQPGDVPITYADISKAQKLLGYNPKTKIEEGMEKFIKWYQENHFKIRK